MLALPVPSPPPPGQCTTNASLQDSCPHARKFVPARDSGGGVLRNACSGNALGLQTMLEAQRQLERTITPLSAKDHIEQHSTPAQLGSWLSSARSGATSAVRRICEVGLNGGHSALAWLCAHPTAEYVSFDLLERNATEAAAAFLSRAFPGRFRLIAGNTLSTLPRLASSPPLGCDVISIDGGHTEEVAWNDLLHLRRHASGARTLIVDDLRCAWWLCNGPTSAWRRAIEANLIAEQSCFVQRCCRGWCTGRYTEPA